MVAIGWRGATSHLGEIQVYLLKLTLPYLTLQYLTLPSFLFVNVPTDQTAEPICTRDASKDAG
jgi:hypothetical protein